MTLVLLINELIVTMHQSSSIKDKAKCVLLDMSSMKLVAGLLAVLITSLLLTNVTPIQVSATPKLSISAAVAEDPIPRGNVQTVTVKVTSNGESVSNAFVSAKIVYASGTIKSFNGKTDISGSWSFSWYIGDAVRAGTFTVKVVAGKSGYDSGSERITFTVTANEMQSSNKEQGKETTPSSPAQPSTESVCGSDPMKDVRKPERFVVLSLCEHAEGKVVKVKKERDGDWHIALKLKPEYEHLLNDVNINKFRGWLVSEVEPKDQGHITKPKSGKKGWCIGIDGPWVTDKEHGWNEIHPVLKLQKIKCA